MEEEECKEYVATLDSLENYWEYPDEGCNWATLGSAMYLDAERYDSKVIRMNPIMEKSFAKINNIVIEKLKESSGQDFKITERFGLPGFHIFNMTPCMVDVEASLHTDQQYNKMLREYPDEYTDDTLSITLALQLPKEGGGLDMFIGEDQYSYKYKVGEMAIQTGKLFHQISSVKKFNEGDRRLTWQAHAIWSKEGFWEVYR